MIIPKINVPTTNGEPPKWVKKTIGDILTIYHGKDYKHLGKGDIPVMGTGGVIAHVDTPLCDWNCVCIGRKGTIDKPYYMDHPFWSVDTLFYTKPKDGYDPLFQYYLFHTINWQKYNEASGVPSLSAKTIGKIEVMVPESLEVQNKIAGVLASIDARIAEQEGIIADLEKRKKGLLKKIFSQELRFKADNGSEFPEWRKRRIGEILTICHGKDYKHLGKGDIPVMGTGGVIAHVDTPLCDWNCVCIGRKGTIDRPYYMDKPFWSVDTLFFTKPCEGHNPRFQFCLFETIDWKRYNEASGVPSLSASTIEKIEVTIPSEVEEQIKIAELFVAIDKHIDIEKLILTDWKNLKTGLLQQMFV